MLPLGQRVAWTRLMPSVQNKGCNETFMFTLQPSLLDYTYRKVVFT